MQAFIAQCWDHLRQEVTDPAQLRCIVPSIRAGNFLRQCIQESQTAPGFLPDIIPIEAFIQEVADLQIIDELPLLFECYQVYLNRQPDQPKEDFDTFSSWATILLGDFNEIDRYLVPTDSFFSYLASIQELNHWSTHDTQSDMVRAYLQFWNELPEYYGDLKDILASKGLGYQGMVYREATEQIAYYLEAKGERPHAFIGFNALNTAEQFLFQEFLAHGSHFVLWDADNHFIGDKGHSASLFMRRYFKTWSYYEKHQPQFIGDNYSTPKDIALVEAANALDQVKEIGNLLKDLSADQQRNTAIVLADEELLLPLLNSLPANVHKVNVTMGVSLKSQPLTLWVMALMELHIRYPKNFYYKALFKVLEHPVCQLILADGSLLVQKMTRENQISINKEAICANFKAKDQHLLELLFASWPSEADSALNRLEQIIASVAESSNDLHRTASVKLLAVCTQLKNMQQRYGSLKSLEALRNIFRQLAGKQQLDFQGDAYDGLQIMGVLESRALDFQRIIMCSVNEGFLPSGSAAPSYITNDMKYQYGLPGLFEKDAIFVYHFYRLLHRAKDITLFYTAVGSGFQAKEESRLIKQLRNNHPQHKISERTLKTKMNATKVALKVIPKDSDILERLQQIAAKQFSPSSLINYIWNPIEFYKQKILGVGPADILEEDIALNTLGSVVHETIETLYKPLAGRKLTEAVLKALLPKITPTLAAQSIKHLGKHYLAGKNRIVFEVAQKYVQFAIQSDLNHLTAGREINLIAVEMPLRAVFDHPSLGAIHLGGTADRVDTLDGKLRIIDYKTGKVEPNQLQLANWEVLTTDYKYSKAFQVLMYGYMYWLEHKSIPDQAGIVSFRKQSEDFMAFGWKTPGSRQLDHQLTEATLNSFEQELSKLIAELFNPEIPFTEKEI